MKPAENSRQTKKTKKTKICISMTLAYPLFNPKYDIVFGGAEVDMYNLAMKLSENTDYEIIFCTGDFGQDHTERYGNVTVRKMKHLGGAKNSPVHKVLRQLWIWRELYRAKADIYITETACEMLAWMVLVGKMLLRAKVIHRLAHDAELDMKIMKSHGLKFYYLYRFGLKHTDTIISQTILQQRLLKEVTGIDSPVIRNGFIMQRDLDIRNKKHILWVARAMQWKRPGLFLELARRLPARKFIIIMPPNKAKKGGLDEKAARLTEEVKRAAAELDNLIYIEYVPFHDIQGYYNDALLFVNTSEYEGFPNSFVQSCLGKTPILSFKVNPDDFIGKYDLGLCCDDNIEKAVDFINGLDSAKIEYYGGNVFRYVDNYHDIDKIVPQYEEVFRKALALRN